MPQKNSFQNGPNIFCAENSRGFFGGLRFLLGGLAKELEIIEVGENPKKSGVSPNLFFQTAVTSHPDF